MRVEEDVIGQQGEQMCGKGIRERSMGWDQNRLVDLTTSEDGSR
jgi:hypothetical protein